MAGSWKERLVIPESSSGMMLPVSSHSSQPTVLHFFNILALLRFLLSAAVSVSYALYDRPIFRMCLCLFFNRAFAHF